MSAAAEGIAGLALSAVSVAALFTTCIECFDIVVAGKNFSEDYEQLCALFSLQRARFGLWGESVGLVPSPTSGRRLRYDKNIDRPDIRPGIERILNNIKSLLEEANKVDARYGTQANTAQSSEISTSKGLNIFKDSYERWKSRIRKHQKDASAWKVTRWAIHDAKEFEGMIGRLKDFVDGLESITQSLGLLQDQHRRLRDEIESISDTQSLRLLRNASCRYDTFDNGVSDTASQRLLVITESIAGQSIYDSGSAFSTITNSFATARTRPSTTIASDRERIPRVPGAWPESSKSSSRMRYGNTIGSSRQVRQHFKGTVSCDACLEEHYKCNVSSGIGHCARCLQLNRSCNFGIQTSRQVMDAESMMLVSHSAALEDFGSLDESEGQGLSQNQRLLKELVQKVKARKPLSFAAGDAHYGEQLRGFKSQDDEYWINHSGKILANANAGSSAAKRMFFELRNIRAARVPFVSAIPLDDNLDQVLASIEGPPETPYEGGIFWITVKLPKNDPLGPPLMRFHTKIYHPNISPQGHICADYREKWESVLSTSSATRASADPNSLWYRKKSTEIQWSLGALLTALCGLLGTPDVDDPLVPEIAMIYLQDYDRFCDNARQYTRKYATGQRPDYSELSFLEEPTNNTVTTSFQSHGKSGLEEGNDSKSLQDSLRTIYEDKFHDIGVGDFVIASINPKKSISLDFDLTSLGRQWYAQYSEDNEITFEGLLRIIHGSARVPVTYSAFILWKFLEKVSLNPTYESTVEGAPSSANYDNLKFRGSVKRVCEKKFLDLMADRKVVVTWSPSKEYTIFISSAHKLRWKFSRSWAAIQELQIALCSLVPFNCCIWKGDLTGRKLLYHNSIGAPPNPRVMCLFLQHALRRLLQTHAKELLANEAFMIWMRPDDNIDSNMASRNEGSSIWGYQINIASFISPVVLTRDCVFRLKYHILDKQNSVKSRHEHGMGQILLLDGGYLAENWSFAFGFLLEDTVIRIGDIESVYIESDSFSRSPNTPKRLGFNASVLTQHDAQSIPLVVRRKVSWITEDEEKFDLWYETLKLLVEISKVQQQNWV